MPTYTVHTPADSTAMAEAVHKAYGFPSIHVENLLFEGADRMADDYEGGSWAFVVNEDGSIGFWYPLDQSTYHVHQFGNGYRNPEMPAATFGAALSLLVVNELAWLFAGQGRDKLAVEFSEKYHTLRDFVFDLAEAHQEFLNGGEIADFID